MQITKVAVTVGRTQNTGNYNNLRFDASYEATVEEGDDPAQLVAELAAKAKEDVVALVWQAKETYGDDWPSTK